MSSVLKALKKLEDKDSQQPQIRTWAHIDTKKTVNRRVRWFWLFNKFLSILILLTTVGVIAGGWFIMIRDPLLVQKLSSTHVSKEKKTDSRPATAVAKTETGPVNSVNTAQEKGAGSEIPRKEAAGSLMYKESPEQGRKKTPVSVGKRGTEPVTFSVKKNSGPNLHQKEPVTLKDSGPDSYQKRHTSASKDSGRLYQKKRLP